MAGRADQPQIIEETHRIALIDGPNMSNLSHRSKKVYGPNQPTIEGLHAYVQAYGKSIGVDVETFVSTTKAPSWSSSTSRPNGLTAT
jgi:hypothetical protein